jgi:hypothetical protein
MTATPAPKPGSAARRGRRRRRWLCFATPFAVLLSLWVVTGVAHAVEEPDLDEPGTLSPLGTGSDGSSVLAGLLRGRGVQVQRVTSSREALRVAAGAGSTVFVPAPDFLTPGFLSLVDDLAGAHRVVVVQPGRRTVIFSPVPIYPVHDRWATASVAPGCGTEFAAAAGPAGVFNESYEVDGPASVDCYAGAVAGVRTRDTEFIYVGASDPFRNDRIGEGGNAALATGLLTEHGRVIWLDVHQREPVSRSELGLPNLPQYRRGELDRGSGGSGTDPFPPALWGGIALAMAAGVLLALARARRLGTPVPEPLPVLVPAAESVTGRGRLYQRIEAQEPALGALRAAAITRMAVLVNPLGGPAPERDLIGRSGQAPPPAAEALIRQIAARSGTPEQAVRQILYGPIAGDNDSFARAVADLDGLVQAVLNPSQHLGGTP